MYIVRVASRQQEKLRFYHFQEAREMQISIVFMYIVRAASRQREKIESLMFSGGQGDEKFHSMYILRVASHQRGKL